MRQLSWAILLVQQSRTMKIMKMVMMKDEDNDNTDSKVPYSWCVRENAAVKVSPLFSPRQRQQGSSRGGHLDYRDYGEMCPKLKKVYVRTVWGYFKLESVKVVHLCVWTDSDFCHPHVLLSCQSSSVEMSLKENLKNRNTHPRQKDDR